MPIKILTPDVAAKIAAGEVVERPASVVKELVENAIDAGATTIRVEVEAGGKQLIKISDDGCGIPAAEVPLAFERHATSKLSTIDDLFNVKTLGFRGEALASIAAVSMFSMLSRPANQSGGIRIRVEGGSQVLITPIGAPAGTLITIENLFYNVPARLKFLKAEATETGYIHRFVSHYAMAYPEIRFSLHSNGRQIFNTDGNGSLYDVLVTIMGLETARQMLQLEFDTADGITVTGYVGSPSLHRAQRDQLVFFINRRWIQDRALAQAVTQAYHTFLPIGRHPVAVLNVTLSPADVDVNVPPTKAEVKFKDPSALFSAIQKPVRAVVVQDAPLVRQSQSFGNAAPADYPDPPLAGLPPGAAANRFGFEAQRTLDMPDFPPVDSTPDSLGLPPLRVVGQIRQTYIITEGPDGLYLIDQHAAHERILYEEMIAQQAVSTVAGQQLLNPPLLELSPTQMAIVQAELAALTAVGFALEPFGGQTYRLLAVPAMLAQADVTTAFADILAEMAEGAVPMARQTHERVAIIVCKRAAIKGGQTLSLEEIHQLIRQLEQTKNPRTCPHGRPTMIHLSAYQLAKEFGRH